MTRRMLTLLVAAVLSLLAVPGAALAATGGPDAFGYYYVDSSEPGGPAAGPFTSIAATGTEVSRHCEDCAVPVQLPFPVAFYGEYTSDAWVLSTGDLQFDSPTVSLMDSLPSDQFDSIVAPLHYDMRTDWTPDDGIWTQTLGDAPHRQFVVEWRAYDVGGNTDSFQLVLTEGSRTLEFRYLDVAVGFTPGLGGNDDLVGIQGGDGSGGNYLVYYSDSEDQPVGQQVASGMAVDFRYGAPNRAATTTAVSPADGSTIAYGSRVSAKVTPVLRRTGTPTGSVSWTVDGASPVTAALANGRAALPPTLLPAGSTHTISAAYSGDGTFAAGSSSPVTITVVPATTTVALTSSLNPAAARQQVKITATVRPLPSGGIPTGTVTFFDGGSQLAAVFVGANGKAHFATRTLAPGNHSITAAYGGDGNYVSSTSPPLQQQIN